MAFNEKELDFGYAIGFLAEWLKDAPAQVKEHFLELTQAIDFYRERVAMAEQVVSETNARYIALMAQSAQYLEFMAQQKEIIDQNLIDNQKEFHNKERELPQI